MFREFGRIIDSIPDDGYIAPHHVQALLHAAGIPLVDEFVSDNKEEVVAFAVVADFQWWQKSLDLCINRMLAGSC